jgi:hypothetical protein
MAQFGDVAVLAVEFCQTAGCTPREAWTRAAKELFSKTSLQNKNCPRATFLVLCEEGLVKGIPPGRYVEAFENREHTLEAVRLLGRDPSLSGMPIQLWKAAIGDAAIGHDKQMHVLTALWNRGLIRFPMRTTE